MGDYVYRVPTRSITGALVKIAARRRRSERERRRHERGNPDSWSAGYVRGEADALLWCEELLRVILERRQE